MGRVDDLGEEKRKKYRPRVSYKDKRLSLQVLDNPPLYIFLYLPKGKFHFILVVGGLLGNVLSFLTFL